MMKNVCVFLGSRLGHDVRNYEATEELGRLFVEYKLRLVYGGGRVGLMGLLADTILKSGGEVIGVIPKFLFSHEVAHTHLTELFEVGSMHERKALMENLSQGFMALPGGFGTLDELCEIITWSQIGLHQKPVALLNVNGFFTPFMEFIKSAEREGFIPGEHVQNLIFEDQARSALDKLVQRLT